LQDSDEIGAEHSHWAPFWNILFRSPIGDQLAVTPDDLRREAGPVASDAARNFQLRGTGLDPAGGPRRGFGGGDPPVDEIYGEPYRRGGSPPQRGQDPRGDSSPSWGRPRELRGGCRLFGTVP